MPRFRVQRTDRLDRPPKTLVLYEEDGIRVRRHRYVNPVRCVECRHSYTAKAEGKLRRMCGFVLGYRDDDGYCDRGERR